MNIEQRMNNVLAVLNRHIPDDDEQLQFDTTPILPPPARGDDP